MTCGPSTGGNFRKKELRGTTGHFHEGTELYSRLHHLTQFFVLITNMIFICVKSEIFQQKKVHSWGQKRSSHMNHQFSLRKENLLKKVHAYVFSSFDAGSNGVFYLNLYLLEKN